VAVAVAVAVAVERRLEAVDILKERRKSVIPKK
jgi:hypothetical protein